MYKEADRFIAEIAAGLRKELGESWTRMSGKEQHDLIMMGIMILDKMVTKEA